MTIKTNTWRARYLQKITHPKFRRRSCDRSLHIFSFSNCSSVLFLAQSINFSVSNWLSECRRFPCVSILCITAYDYTVNNSSLENNTCIFYLICNLVLYHLKIASLRLYIVYRCTKLSSHICTVFSW